MRALVLDFDGVISDSAPEAFVVALRTFVTLRPDSPHRDALAALDPLHPGESLLYRPFLELMPLGNRAEDYAVALAALEHGAAIPDQEAYDAFHRSVDPAWLRAFHARFYTTREEWSRADPVGWRRGLAPYPRVVELLRRHAGEVELAIASAKDHRSVRALLADYGIADLFPAGRVLDKEAGVAKTAHLRALHERLDVCYPEMTFVDDKVNHLDAVAGLGVRCALAGWGYNTPREHVLARARRYALLSLDDMEAQLF
jgi:phosphoglycolate phosphatase-like HAD superfamily hydrolase